MNIKKRIIKPQAVHETNHHVEHGYSLSEVHRSIEIPKTGSKWKKFLAFTGPGLLVAVGYMDPGNWATDLAGGAQFGYTLLSVILISNILAILLQALPLKLGIATGRDLAQECKDQYSKPLTYFLWFLAEIAIAATDHLRRVDHRTGCGTHPLP